MRTTEIGSEFWDVPTSDNHSGQLVFPRCTQWYLSGRSALQATIHELNGCHSVAMPSWCCDSMIKPFADSGIEVRFYPVLGKEQSIHEAALDCDAVLLMDYFGYTGQSVDLPDYHGLVIRDMTHSLFSSVYSDADYYFGSLRKWVGVWTGGYAWARDGHQMAREYADDLEYIKFRETAMRMKYTYINSPEETDKTFRIYYEAAEACLDHVGERLLPAAERDVALAQKLDTGFLIFQRRSNAEFLRTAFRDWLVFPDMNANDCPMFVPIIVPCGKRDELRRYLIENRIYCPVHWPISKYHQLGIDEKYIYDNALSLVCDQRYTEEDMGRIVETIQAYWKKVSHC